MTRDPTDVLEAARKFGLNGPTNDDAKALAVVVANLERERYVLLNRVEALTKALALATTACVLLPIIAVVLTWAVATVGHEP